MIPLTTVTSSSIQAIGWKDNSGMEVIFHNRPDKVYQYPDVAELDAHRLMQSDSVGKAFTRLYRDSFFVERPFDALLDKLKGRINWESEWLASQPAVVPEMSLFF